MKRLLFPLCAIALVSCSAHGSVFVPAAGSGSGHTSVPFQLPIISADFIRNAGRVHALNTKLPSLPRFLRTGPAFGRLSTVGPGDHEIEGIAINPSAGSPYTGIFAVQTAYTKQFVQIGYPPGAGGTSSLIAPLIVPPNKSCLATGQLYGNPGTGTTANFFVLDRCAGTIPFATPIDTAFSENYTRIAGRGVPELISLIITLDGVPGPSSVWHALLYNYTTRQFDLVASSKGISATGTGLSVWLGEFVAGPCPVTPTIAADSMFLYNGTSKRFEIMQPTMTATTTSAFSSKATCFAPDQSGPASFAFAVDTPNSSWSVHSTPPAPVITEFSSGITGMGLSGITGGPDGNVWFTESLSRQIGRITPGGAVSEFSNGISLSSAPYQITSGPDGNLWFTEGDTVARTTSAGITTEFSGGLPSGAGTIGITSGPDGNVWFAEEGAARVGRITPTGVVTQFSTGITGPPFYITSGPDGNLWFTEFDVDRIGRITPTGVVTEFSNGINPGAVPFSITSAPDGNLWFTEEITSIARITPNGVVTEFSNKFSAPPSYITSGPDGNLWFTENGSDRIGRITPAGVVTEYASGITKSSGPWNITTGADGSLWFTEYSGNRIARVVL